MQKLDAILLYSKDIPSSLDFYESVGFEIKNQTDQSFIAKLSDFSLFIHDENQVEFKKDSKIEPKGAGVFFHINTNNLDDFYQEMISKGLTPSSKPTDWPWGRREFVIKDPDGYKLVFYKNLD